jgi:Lrp/AsnC family transcriptional regulator
MSRNDLAKGGRAAMSEGDGLYDALDRRILDVLQDDVSLSLADLAEKVGSSKSVCWRRMQGYLEAGIIQGRVAVLDAKKLGFGVMILASVKLDGRGEGSIEEFIASVRAIPEIIECHALMGDVDIMLKIVVPSIDYYEEMLWRRLSSIPGIIDIRSSISLTRFVNSTKLPLSILRAEPRPVSFTG